MKKVEVVAGILVHKDEILCVQRAVSTLPYISKKFEFPGGKIEANETQIDALHRELLEELCVETDIRSHFLTVVHQYPDFELTMHSYLCNSETKELNLTEHISYQWLKKEELEKLDWAAADIPIVQKLIADV